MPEKMVRCQDGHFYDPAKYNACPWCNVAAEAAPAQAAESAEGKTRAMRPADADRPGMAAASRPQQEWGATKPLHRAPTGVSPVVGWLVCVEGPDRGRDYRLHMEKNFIGRAPGMDVALTGDDSISREKHASVTFDPKKKAFWLVPGDSSGLVYLNDELVNAPVQIQPDDVIELGKSKLVLAPFTSAKFQW